jgi:hypothetical protein
VYGFHQIRFTVLALVDKKTTGMRDGGTYVSPMKTRRVEQCVCEAALWPVSLHSERFECLPGYLDPGHLS